MSAGRRPRTARRQVRPTRSHNSDSYEVAVADAYVRGVHDGAESDEAGTVPLVEVAVLELESTAPERIMAVFAGEQQRDGWSI